MCGSSSVKNETFSEGGSGKNETFPEGGPHFYVKDILKNTGSPPAIKNDRSLIPCHYFYVIFLGRFYWRTMESKQNFDFDLGAEYSLVITPLDSGNLISYRLVITTLFMLKMHNAYRLEPLPIVLSGHG